MPELSTFTGTDVRLSQQQLLAPQALMGINLLAKSLPELRAEVIRQIESNPALEDVDHPLETSITEVETLTGRDDTPDYPDEDFEPGRNVDEDRVEQRQEFFDRQVKIETLQEHLLAQLPLSTIDPADWSLVEVLIGDLDENGFHHGSIADACMVFGKSEAEINELLHRIAEFDPPGCGSRTAKDCLLAQLDKLEDSPYLDDVRQMIESHLSEIAAGKHDQVAATLGLTKEQYRHALSELQTLNPHPGRNFPSERDRVEYVNPEIHAEKRNGYWYANTDQRSLPEVRISARFEAMLKDENQTEETRAYIRERIEAAKAFREAVERRQQTIASIAQTIFDRQQEFFEKGVTAIRPLTELEVAKSVGVAGTTVSRTVRDKYAETPFGTFELRRFFTVGVKNSEGEMVSQTAVLATLKKIVENEDARNPLTDQAIADAMAAAGYPIARRTVVKYRNRLGIPGRSERR